MMSEFRQLSESECRARLAECQTGRVAVTTPDGPQIIPVNYALVDETVVFRTSPKTVLATYAPGRMVAFEVEQVDEVTKAGWSVLARGRATPVFDSRQLAQIRRIWEPTPWANGERNLHIRITIRKLSGRSVGVLPRRPGPGTHLGGAVVSVPTRGDQRLD